jgi:23S rRNA (adenine2503-C2)-methyltransferase
VHLRGVFPEELCARFGADGLDLPGARRIVSAAWRGDFALRTVRDVTRRALAAVRAGAEAAQIEPVGDARAQDGFVRTLFRGPGGAQFECVRIPLDPAHGVHFSACLSSQAGCALACAFCATGRLGPGRNLKAWEMTAQFCAVRDSAPGPTTSAVFMGMGEPFQNYDEVIRAARLLQAPYAGKIFGRSITLSTVGLTPVVRRYTREGWPFRLSISLTSAIPEKRAALMPIERAYPLRDLVAAALDHARTRGERVNIAYVCLAGVNMGEEDARALGALLGGQPVRLDLIEVADRSGRFQAPSRAELSAFRDALFERLPGVPVARRYSGGSEVDAGCGMLAAAPIPLHAGTYRESA